MAGMAGKAGKGEFNIQEKKGPHSGPRFSYLIIPEIKLFLKSLNFLVFREIV